MPRSPRECCASHRGHAVPHAGECLCTTPCMLPRAVGPAGKKCRRTCRRKTLAGNLYGSMQEAAASAAQLKGKTVTRLVAYRCRACGDYHVGKVETVDRYRPKGKDQNGGEG